MKYLWAVALVPLLVSATTVKRPSLADLYKKEVKVSQLKWDLMEYNLRTSLTYNTYETKPTFHGAFFDKRTGRVEVFFDLLNYRRYFKSAEDAKEQLTRLGKDETSRLVICFSAFDRAGNDWYEVNFSYSNKEVASYEKGELIVHLPEYLQPQQAEFRKQ